MKRCLKSKNNIIWSLSFFLLFRCQEFLILTYKVNNISSGLIRSEDSFSRFKINVSSQIMDAHHHLLLDIKAPSLATGSTEAKLARNASSGAQWC